MLADEQVRALLGVCRETREEEIDCDAFLASVPAYAEARASGGAVPAALVKVAEHEALCANCREECEALVEMVRALRAPTG